MFFILIVTVLFGVVAEIQSQEANCDKLGILVYEDLGCKPIRNKPTDPCPSSYDCRHFHDFGTHCYFQGDKYEVNDVIPSNITDLSCNAGCYCTSDGSFTCAILDCPEWLNPTPPSKECTLTYELNKCCSVGTLCKPSKEVETCEVGGQIYKEGQKFYPEGTCSICICQKGFKGKYEAPYCRPLNCGTELKNRRALEGHCAPVYRDRPELCCPNFWSCLSEDDVINTIETPSKLNATCIFGNKNVKLGEYIEKTVDRYGKRHSLHCECSLPPLLTCVIKESVPSAYVL